jgi:hypothetical protein
VGAKAIGDPKANGIRVPRFIAADVPLRRNYSLKERRRHTCQGTRANYEVDQMDYFRLELFGEYLVLR